MFIFKYEITVISFCYALWNILKSIKELKMIKSNRPVHTEGYVALTKWDPLKANKGKEETNTQYQVDKKEMKLKRRPLRRGQR